MGPVAQQMKERLEAAFAPTRLDIIDDSDKHHGHAGHREGGESHFTVVIESAAFSGLGRVERLREPILDHVTAFQRVRRATSATLTRMSVNISRLVPKTNAGATRSSAPGNRHPKRRR